MKTSNIPHIFARVSPDGADDSWQEVGRVQEGIAGDVQPGLFGSHGCFSGPDSMVFERLEMR